MHTTHASLLERLRLPEEQAAWERFVQLYTPLLHRMAQRLDVPEADEADLLQDVFAVLVRELPEFKYDPRLRFRGWLWTVLANKWREQRRRRSVSTGADAASLADIAVDDPRNAAEEAADRACVMQRALELLRPQFQANTWEAFQACTAGRPAPEVAKQLGLSLAAVYAAKSRVLQRLRQELEGLLD
jgi:RNA polymerase sigma-70 factor (ECF subfamily)